MSEIQVDTSTAGPIRPKKENQKTSLELHKSMSFLKTYLIWEEFLEIVTFVKR